MGTPAPSRCPPKAQCGDTEDATEVPRSILSPSGQAWLSWPPLLPLSSSLLLNLVSFTPAPRPHLLCPCNPDSAHLPCLHFLPPSSPSCPLPGALSSVPLMTFHSLPSTSLPGSHHDPLIPTGTNLKQSPKEALENISESEAFEVHRSEEVTTSSVSGLNHSPSTGKCYMKIVC